MRFAEASVQQILKDCFYFKQLLVHFKCVDVLPAYISLNHMPAWCSHRSEEGIRFPKIEVNGKL